MTIRRMTPALTFATVLSITLGLQAFAQEAAEQPAPEPAPAVAATESAGPTLADLGKDEAFTVAFQKMAEGNQIPEWLSKGAVVTPTQKVSFGGKKYLAMTGCQQHDCGTNRIAVLYAPDSGTAYGVLAVRDGESSELLTWLGLGGGPETIDGRTILYAALTGSLANHPEAFNYPE